MPRKSRPPKNRYCFHSRLSNEAFEALLFCYVSNANAQDTAACLLEREGVKISRQSVSKYFLNIGYHLFLNFYYPSAFLLILEEEGKIRKGFGEDRSVFGTLHTGLVDSLIQSGELDLPTLNEMHVRILRVPYKLMRYMEGEDSAGSEAIEKTTDGTLFTRLRDNQLLISTLRLIRQRTFGYAREHFLSYFGKAYFIDVTGFPSEGRKGDEAILKTSFTPLMMCVWLRTYLATYPMTLREPSEWGRIIEERFARFKVKAGPQS